MTAFDRDPFAHHEIDPTAPPDGHALVIHDWIFVSNTAREPRRKARLGAPAHANLEAD